MEDIQKMIIEDTGLFWEAVEKAEARRRSNKDKQSGSDTRKAASQKPQKETPKEILENAFSNSKNKI